MKPKAKKKVQKLRKEGLSHSEILEKVSVSKGTVSRWCQDVELTQSQKDRLKRKEKDFRKKGPKIKSRRREKEINKIKGKAKEEIEPPSLYEQKIIGAMLYRAEGYKSCGVGLSNSNPELIKFMVEWLRKIKKPSKNIKAQLNIHQNQNDDRIKKYWSKITKVPLNQFTKSYIKAEGTGHRKNHLENGVVKIKIYSEDLRHKIMAWSEDLIEDPFPKKAKYNLTTRLKSTIKKSKRKKEIEKIKTKAKEDIQSLNEHQFKLAGIALYWGEGGKKGLNFSNSDPKMIRFIMKWFRNVCEIPEKKFKLTLYLHEHQNKKDIKEFWSEITDIPLSQFNKTIIKKGSYRDNHKNYRGTLQIKVYNEDLKHRILAWVEQLQTYLCPANSIGRVGPS